MLINNAVITGSLTVNGTDVTYITGSSQISSSFLALSSSYLITSASYVVTSGSYAITSASFAQTSGSLSVRTGNLEATSSTLTSASSSFAAQSASLSTRLTADETNITTLTNASASFAAQSASLSTRLTTDETNFSTTSGSLSTRVTNLEATSSTVSSSFASTSGSIAGRVTLIEGQYATTGSNTFTNIQYISSSTNAAGFTTSASLYTDGGARIAKDLFVSGTTYLTNLTVYGTASVQYITSSQINVGANIIYLNTQTPAVRYGGMAVADSGSNAGVTGSMLWDSVNNGWIYTRESGSTYSGGALISGPRSSVQGSEQGTLNNYITKGQGGDHITSSQIIDDGTTVQIPGNLQVTGSLVNTGAATFGSTVTAGGIVSGSVLLAGGATNIDSSLAVQVSSAGTGTQKWIGINKNNTYGLIIGYNEVSAGLSGVGAYIRQVTSDPMYFVVNNTTTALTIASTGAATFSNSVTSAGITSTGTNAMVSATSSTAGLVVRGGSSIGTASSASGQILVGVTSAYRLSLAYDDNTGYAYIDNLYDNANSNIYFRVRTNGTPINALTLFGTGAATFSSTIQATGVNIGTASPVGKLSSINTGNANTPSNSAIWLSSSATAASDGLGIGSSALLGYKWIQSYDGALALNPAGNNVLIGTTTDAGYKLDVNGTGRFSGDLTGTSATFSGNVAINGTIIGTDQTFGGAYRTFAFGTNSNGFNRIFAANDTSDGLYLNSATGRGIYFRVNGGGANVVSIESTGAATFSSSVQATAMSIGVAPTANILVVRGENANNDGTIQFGIRGFLQHRDAGNTITSLANDYNSDSAKMEFRMKGNATSDAKVTILGSGNVGIGMTPDVNLQVKAISGNNTTFRIGPSASGFELNQDNGGYTVCTVKNIYATTSNLAELSLQSGFITFKTGTSLTTALTIASTGAATFNSTVTLPNNTYLQFNNSSGTARTILAVDTSNSTVLRPAASGGVIAIQNYANTVNLLTIAESTGYTTLASPQATVGNDGGAQKKLVTIGLDGQDYRYRYILLCKVPTFGNSTVNCGFRGTITMERTNGIGIDVHDDFDLTVSYGNTIEFRQTSYQSYQTSLVQLPYNGVQYLALFIYSAPGYSVAYIDAIQTNYGSWLDGNEFTALNYATSQHSSISYGTNNTTFKTTVVATGDVTAYSDRNLKTNINTIDNALSKLNLLRGVSYNRTDIETDKLKIGVIAQEVEEVIPEVVSTDKNGVKSVAYGNMVGVLIEAIKEQQLQIEELKTLVYALTK